MAWGSKYERLIAERAAVLREVELLREQLEEKKLEIVELKKQLKYTQDALVAKEAPEVYNDQKYFEDQAAKEDPKVAKWREEQIMQSKIMTEYLKTSEGPLFKDADDMIDILSKGAKLPLQETKSLHGNDES